MQICTHPLHFLAFLKIRQKVHSKSRSSESTSPISSLSEIICSKIHSSITAMQASVLFWISLPQNRITVHPIFNNQNRHVYLLAFSSSSCYSISTSQGVLGARRYNSQCCSESVDFVNGDSFNSEGTSSRLLLCESPFLFCLHFINENPTRANTLLQVELRRAAQQGAAGQGGASKDKITQKQQEFNHSDRNELLFSHIMRGDRERAGNQKP